MRNADFSPGSRGTRCSRTVAFGLVVGTLALVCSAGAAPPPAADQETGCCCVTVPGGKAGCGQKTQEECLAEQPKVPTYDRLPDWAHAVAESRAQERQKVESGWRAGRCPP